MKLPPYPAELDTCEERAEARLKLCLDKADTAGEVSQCQTKHGKTGFSCLDASERLYRSARKGE